MKTNRFQVQRDQLATEGPQKWLATLLPKVERLRAQLVSREPRLIAQQSGTILENEQLLRLTLWDKEYTITVPDYRVYNADGTEARTDRQVLILMYLHTADGTPPEYRWLRYRELPGGLFYSHAFSGYAEKRLADAFHNQPDAFSHSATRLGGIRLSFGNSESFAFFAMPRIRLAAVLWAGDDDLPSSATILFDAGATHYLPTDVLGALGSQLVSRLMGVPDDVGQTLTALAVQPPKT
jgi:hypothetical protein